MHQAACHPLSNPAHQATAFISNHPSCLRGVATGPMKLGIWTVRRGLSAGTVSPGHPSANSERPTIFPFPFGRHLATESSSVRIAGPCLDTAPERRRQDLIRGLATSLRQRYVTGCRRFSVGRSGRLDQARQTPPPRTLPFVQERMRLHEKRNARQCLPT
jgi:hypothetical protein